jgi:integrase
MAHAMLAIIRRTLSWFSARSDDYANPLAVRGLGRVNAKERARERTLNDDEIRRVWKAADGFEGPEGRFVQFLLAVACRRNEAAGLRFEERGRAVQPSQACQAGARRQPARASRAGDTLLSGSCGT